MPKAARPLAIALFLLLSFTPAAFAAEAVTVKVALLDMSVLAAPGTIGPGARVPGGPGSGPGGAGQGMMGPGQRGPGGGGSGGWQGGYGPGWMGPSMMGQGMMGQGMMGQGWMGQGMMGMMSIRAVKDTVKAGTVRFEVINYSAAVTHEMLVVAVEDFNAPLPYDYDTARVVEDKIKELGEVEIGPGGEKTLELDLPAGSYLLLCNLPGHYAAGMVTPFMVTP